MFKSPTSLKTSEKTPKLPKFYDLWVEITKVRPKVTRQGHSAIIPEFRILEVSSQQVVGPEDVRVNAGDSRSLYFAIDPATDEYGYNVRDWSRFMSACGIPDSEQLEAQELCYGPENFLMGKQIRIQRVEGKNPNSGATFLANTFSSERPTKAA